MSTDNPSLKSKALMQMIQQLHRDFERSVLGNNSVEVITL